MALDHEFATVVSNTTAVTGSITKIYNLTESRVSNITFGKYGGHGTTSAMTGSSGGLMWKGTNKNELNLIMTAADTIEGPMCAIKLSSGTAIVYHKGTLIT